MNAEKQSRTFISYSRVDKEFALEFSRELRSAGFLIWLDQLDIPTGARWDDEIEKALSECEIFLIILTPASTSSENVKDEIGYAIDHGKRILPVLLEECVVPLRFRRFQYVDFTKMEFSDGVKRAKQLLQSLINEPSTSVFRPVSSVESQKDAKPRSTTMSSRTAPKKTLSRRKPMGGVGLLVITVILGAIIVIGGLIVLIGNNMLFRPANETQSPSFPNSTQIELATSTDVPFEQPNATIQPQKPTLELPVAIPTFTVLPPTLTQVPSTRVPPANAFLIPVGYNPVTIDGICDSNNEYSDALSSQFQDYGQQDGTVYFKHDGEFLYICMKAVLGPNSERFATVNLASDNSNQTFGEIRVDFGTGRTSAYGVSGWSANLTTVIGFDMAEYRLPITETGGSPCYKVFRIEVFHYWVTGSGDDYAWGNVPGVGYGQPEVWPRVALNCIP